jgi:hypothetical protein
MVTIVLARNIVIALLALLSLPFLSISRCYMVPAADRQMPN